MCPPLHRVWQQYYWTNVNNCSVFSPLADVQAQTAKPSQPADILWKESKITVLMTTLSLSLEFVVVCYVSESHYVHSAIPSIFCHKRAFCNNMRESWHCHNVLLGSQPSFPRLSVRATQVPTRNHLWIYPDDRSDSVGRSTEISR